MEQQLDIHIERIDDVPLLLRHLESMGLAELIDASIHPHGNWGERLSLGETITVWLTYIISQGDHRLCAVEEWVESLLETLQRLVSPALTPQALCDDRLERVLRYLAQDKSWEILESGLSEHLVRIYALPEERVRVDMSTVSTYAQVTPEGLVQFGFSKEHRPDLPQVKVGLAVLDPLGMPLATTVVSGNQADDPLYVPLIRRVHELLGAGKMYVGDSKMAAAATRAVIHQQGDVYLCPAPRTIVSDEIVKRYVTEAHSEGRIEHWRIERSTALPLEGEGFVVREEMCVEVAGEEVVWEEERWVLRSQKRHERAVRRLDERLSKAEAALKALNKRGRGKRRYPTQEHLAERVEEVLKRHKVEELLKVTYRSQVTERRVRGYKGRPARVERQEDWFVEQVVRDEGALEECRKYLGWRVYLNNGAAQGHPVDAEAVIRACHGQYTVEQGFGRMRKQPIGISPMYLQRDDHRVGLMRLFSLALRVVTLLEYRVREAMAQQNKTLYGLYEGNPRRGTRRPTAERLLWAFKGLHFSVVHQGREVIYHVTPLSHLQQAILNLLEFPTDTYTMLVTQSTEPP